jgi:hypothetical protein
MKDIQIIWWWGSMFLYVITWFEVLQTTCCVTRGIFLRKTIFLEKKCLAPMYNINGAYLLQPNHSLQGTKC